MFLIYQSTDPLGWPIWTSNCPRLITLYYAKTIEFDLLFFVFYPHLRLYTCSWRLYPQLLLLNDFSKTFETRYVYVENESHQRVSIAHKKTGEFITSSDVTM